MANQIVENGKVNHVAHYDRVFIKYLFIMAGIVLLIPAVILIESIIK